MSDSVCLCNVSRSYRYVAHDWIAFIYAGFKLWNIASNWIELNWTWILIYFVVRKQMIFLLWETKRYKKKWNRKCAEPIRLQTPGLQTYRCVGWLIFIHRHVAAQFTFIPRIVLLAAEHRWIYNLSLIRRNDIHYICNNLYSCIVYKQRSKCCRLRLCVCNCVSLSVDTKTS